ncbi:MBL fold metallo-hydrolase [Jannaschia aquimarina]|uniref:Rbn_2 protein n=1 Tax=Jannaschia aquimarina TaxID=935700 RepID=A0A0D1EC99_9RHOB|nr:MBL fold metallo-hydrolase [Jannaschia aquimarina]KIT14551.1 Ribonuclease BN [Jannaschia aquimarina]SNT35325.1 Ribonuclease BN, tRNA processing enzyme [Jannaschia aquimarina]
MMENWVALLGVKGGPAIRPGSSMPTSILVKLGGRTILVDAGLGAARAVCAQGVALGDLDLIVITHLHSDHYLELGPLMHTAWTGGLTRPIPVIGPAGLQDYWRHFLASMSFDVDLRIADEGRVPLAPVADIHEIEAGPIWSEGVRIEAIRNHHPPIAESFALRICGAERTVVLSGDTAPFDGWAAFCEGADLLVHEAMLSGGVDLLIERLSHADPRLRDHILRSHTEAGEVGRLAHRAGVKALALNHFVPDGLPGTGPEAWTEAVRAHWDGPLFLGRDGLRIDLDSIG